MAQVDEATPADGEEGEFNFDYEGISFGGKRLLQPMTVVKVMVKKAVVVKVMVKRAVMTMKTRSDEKIRCIYC